MNRLKVKVLNYVVRHLFNGITDDDVLALNKKGEVYVNNLLLPKENVKGMASGARSLAKMEIWKILNKEMKNIANQKIYITSSSIDDIIFGKAMLYNLEVLNKKIENLSRLDV